MTELVKDFLEWGATTPWEQWFTLAIFVCYVLSHIVQYLPVSVTTKIPDWVMVIINTVAAKHGATESAKTDIKGNLK